MYHNINGGYGAQYTYDAFGRFSGLGSGTFTYAYEPDSDLISQFASIHSLTSTRAYEPQRDVLTQVKNQFGPDIISQYDYASDALRRRTSMTTSGQAFEPPAPNPLSASDTTYTTNPLNQYTSIQHQASSIQLAYDLDGNLSNDGTVQYDYDAENRLISVTPLTPQEGDTKTEYLYDYMGRRVQKKVLTFTSGSWILDAETVFVYDGWNLIREEISRQGQTTTNMYIWGLDLSGSLQGAGGIGGLLTWFTNDGSTTMQYLYLYDANGNVGQVVDRFTGTIAAHYEYDPFGNLLVADGPEAQNNPFRFSTKYFDAETGLYYYGFRYYSPKLGRWLTRDPIGEEGGLNLYGFVGNQPVNLGDPRGLTAHVCLKKHKCSGIAEVSITIPLKYEGPGATPEVIGKFNAGIENTWSGIFGKYHVTTRVLMMENVKEYPPDPSFVYIMYPYVLMKAEDVKRLTRHPNIVYVPLGDRLPPIDDRPVAAKVNCVGGNEGVWPDQVSGKTAAHEAGHMMNLEDRYTWYSFPDGTGICVPKKQEWKNSIMACPSEDRAPLEVDIKDIVNDLDLHERLFGGCGWVGDVGW